MPTDAVAAIDLGSNSFHLIVARTGEGDLLVIDRLKEMVQLAAGLDDQRRLSEAAQARALDCLARFGQRLAHMPASRVRIAGTNTLRQARNGAEFVARAEALLGHPIEIISGVEEARLIYLGVAHSTAAQGRRLVIDIGGGSTELIVGEQFEPQRLESLYLGCVTMTCRCFGGGELIREAELRAAEIAVGVELEPVEAGLRAERWGEVIGASGSVKAIRDVLAAQGWSGEDISREALARLRTALIGMDRAALAARFKLEPARAAVFVGGFAVLHGLFERLGLERMQVSDGALREGLIWDLLGRIRHEDVRGRTIAALAARFGVDLDQVGRVAATAEALRRKVERDWELGDEDSPYLLDWAARLHELGLMIAHSQYHKHGAYVVQNADMAGFSRPEQALLAALVRGHRRKLPLEAFAALPPADAERARRLCLLLRLAAVLHRSRSRQPLPTLRLEASGRTLRLRFPEGWLAEHPLTRADLEVEAELLAAARYRLEVEGD